MIISHECKYKIDRPRNCKYLLFFKGFTIDNSTFTNSSIFDVFYHCNLLEVSISFKNGPMSFWISFLRSRFLITRNVFQLLNPPIFILSKNWSLWMEFTLSKNFILSQISSFQIGVTLSKIFILSQILSFWIQ